MCPSDPFIFLARACSALTLPRWASYPAVLAVYQHPALQRPVCAAFACCGAAWACRRRWYQRWPQLVALRVSVSVCAAQVSWARRHLRGALPLLWWWHHLCPQAGWSRCRILQALCYASLQAFQPGCCHRHHPDPARKMIPAAGLHMLRCWCLPVRNARAVVDARSRPDRTCHHPNGAAGDCGRLVVDDGCDLPAAGGAHLLRLAFRVAPAPACGCNVRHAAENSRQPHGHLTIAHHAQAPDTFRLFAVAFHEPCPLGLNCQRHD